MQLLDHVVAQERGRRLLDELLVAALHRTVARRVHGEVAVRIAAALGLHMPAMVDETLHEVLVEVAALHGVVVQVEAAQLVVVAHERDAPSAAAVRALEHERVAVRVCEVEQHAHVAERMRDARHRRHLGVHGHAACADLVSQIGERARRRADPCGAGLNHLVGETRHFGEESVARVHRVGAGTPENVYEEVFVEVGVGVGVTREQECLVRHLDILRMAVLLGVHDHGGDAHFTRGAHHTQGDLAAVDDE